MWHIWDFHFDCFGFWVGWSVRMSKNGELFFFQSMFGRWECQEWGIVILSKYGKSTYIHSHYLGSSAEFGGMSSKSPTLSPIMLSMFQLIQVSSQNFKGWKWPKGPNVCFRRAKKVPKRLIKILVIEHNISNHVMDLEPHIIS